MTIKYRYINKPENQKDHSGVVTIATELVDPRTLKIGISCCSKRDVFDKRIAKIIASSRLDKSNILYTVTNTEPVFKQIVEIILNETTDFKLSFRANEILTSVKNSF